MASATHSSLPDVDNDLLQKTLKDIYAGVESIKKPFPKDDVNKRASQLVPNILAQYEILRASVNSHETVIRARWQKKSVVKRKDILRKIWPNMTANHRSDSQFFIKGLLLNRPINWTTPVLYKRPTQGIPPDV